MADAGDDDRMWRPRRAEPAVVDAPVAAPDSDEPGDPVGAERSSDSEPDDMIDDVLHGDATMIEEVDGEPAGSPWSVGSGATFADTTVAEFDLSPTPAVRTGPAEPSGSASVRRVVIDGEVIALPPERSNRRRLAVVVMAAAVVVAAVIVVRDDGLDGNVSAGLSDEWIYPDFAGAGEVVVTSGEFVDPLVDEPFAGADRRRLPEQLDQRWSTEVLGVEVPSGADLTLLDDGSVLGVFDDLSVVDGELGTVVVALDAGDGSERWRSQFESTARDLSVLAEIDGVVVMERRSISGQSLLGLSASTGEVLWADEIDRSVSYSVVAGTSLVARDSNTEFPPLSFIDPATGEEVGRPPGRILANDVFGTVYFRDGDELLRLDLSSGWASPVPVGELVIDGADPAAVVGGRIVAVVDGDVEVRGDDGTLQRASIVGAGSGGFAGLDTAPVFTLVASMGDDAMLLLGAGAAFGAELLDDGDVAVRWRASGTPIGFTSTDRGASIVMATEGGGEQRVIDGSTGREIASVDMVPGAIDVLQLVGNGVVVKRSATIGFERVGLDLDGNRLWSLVGDGPLFVGRGAVATYVESDGGLTVTAYGDVVP